MIYNSYNKIFRTKITIGEAVSEGITPVNPTTGGYKLPFLGTYEPNEDASIPAKDQFQGSIDELLSVVINQK